MFVHFVRLTSVYMATRQLQPGVLSMEGRLFSFGFGRLVVEELVVAKPLVVLQLGRTDKDHEIVPGQCQAVLGTGGHGWVVRVAPP